MTAYNSEAAQCDSSPCITANGFNLCEHGIEDSVAANFLKFGTKIRIPELFGDKVFIVRDRMNSRYQNRVDIWMKEKQDALNFGIKYAKIEILEP
jgi:3D (Asp-Asp-Asp) domain-containing protein